VNKHLSTKYLHGSHVDIFTWDPFHMDNIHIESISTFWE